MVGDTAGEMIKIDQKWVIYHIYGDSKATDLLLGIIETPCILEFISDDYYLWTRSFQCLKWPRLIQDGLTNGENIIKLLL